MKFLTIAVLASLLAVASSVTCWIGGSSTSNKPVSTGSMRPEACIGTNYCSKILQNNAVQYTCGILCDKKGKKDLPGAVMYCCDGDKCNSVGAKGISFILMAVSLVTSLAL